MNAEVNIPEAPRNVAAEMQIIAAMLQDNAKIDYCADRLRKDDFYEPIHGGLFDLIISEHSQGRAVNPITLKPFLKDWPALEELGGAKYLISLTAEGGAQIGFAGFIDQVADLSRRRKMFDGLNRASAMATDLEQPLENIITTADGAVSGHGGQDGIEQLTGLQAFDAMLDSQRNPSYGVKSGHIGALDDVLGVIRPKELIIMAARPGMGKTACALSYALGAAQGGHGVLFVSLEMSAPELAGRMAADLCFGGQSSVPYAAIKNGDLNSGQKIKMSQARSTISELPLRIIDAGKLTTGRLSMLIMRTKRRMEAQGQTLDLVIVDYLQLMTPDHRTSGMYEKISEVSIALKATAKMHNVAMMALAQLSREVEKRPDKRPQLSDLRDSGQIEQDADGVLFLLRNEYYLRLEMGDETSPAHQKAAQSLLDHQNKIEFIVAKRRNGLTGSNMGSFYGEFQAVRS